MEIIIIAFIAFIAGSVSSGIGKSRSTHSPLGSVKKSFNRSQPKGIDEQFLEASRVSLYGAQTLLNKSEKSIYWSLVKFLSKNYCVNPQASLGEILTCENKLGYRAINSKRSDFVVTDKRFEPVAVIEYQGDGHYQSNYKNRDLIKRHALNKAGIAFIQLSDVSESHVRETLEECNFKMN